MTSNTYQQNLWANPIDPKPDVSTMRVALSGKDIDPLLHELLSHATPHGFESEICEIITKWVAKTCPELKPHVDPKGNLHIKVGDSRTMFSCHMDTVHRIEQDIQLHMSDELFVHASMPTEVSYYTNDKGDTVAEHAMRQEARAAGHSYTHYTLFANHGVANKRQLFGSASQLDGWQPTGITYTVETAIQDTPCILGADDKLGCYIMCRLIEAGISGYYVFHVGEECGGIGSTYLSEHRADMFKKFDHCVAFDRMRYEDIITHQSGGRCCSDEFAQALADQMNPNLPPMQQMAPSPNGSFTDSANYTKLIPECTNVAVGYFSQHGVNEKFDHEWLEKHLIPALLKVDWSALPVARKVGVPDAPRFRGTRGYSDSYGQRHFRYSSPKSSAVVSRRWPESRKAQSAVDKFMHCIDAVPAFDSEEGFFPNESHRHKVNRVLASFIRDGMSLEDIAELIVELNDKHEYDNFKYDF